MHSIQMRLKKSTVRRLVSTFEDTGLVDHRKIQPIYENRRHYRNQCRQSYRIWG